jgi:Spy/CpxP family protein refolding chaperone
MKHNVWTIAVGAVLATGMAFAQTAPVTPRANRAVTGQPSGRARMHQEMMQQLNLSPQQKAEAKNIFGSSWQSSKPIFDQLRQNNAALAAAVKNNDQARIQQLSAEQGKLRGQLVQNHEMAMAKFYQTLNPQQRAKADQLQAQAQARMQQRFNQMQQRHMNGNTTGE